MAELLVQFPTITGIGAVAPDGVQFCSGCAGSRGMSFADRPYFQQALHDKSLAISGYIIGRGTGRPQLNFAYPALDSAGEVQAVVVLAFSLGRLSQGPVGDGAAERRARSSLVDGDGVLLARAPPAPEWIGRRRARPSSAKAMLAQREGVMEGAGIDGSRASVRLRAAARARPICSRWSGCRGRRPIAQADRAVLARDAC